MKEGHGDRMIVSTDARLATRKLYSPNNTLLGTITFPAYWEQTLEKQNWVRFRIWTEREARDAFAILSDDKPFSDIAPMRIGTIERRHGWLNDGGVYLHDVSLEEFERIPGCSFTPSAGYIRSIME